MKYSIFGYLIGEGFRNVFKNKKSTIASLIIMCATMFVFGIFFMVEENVNHLTRNIEEQQGIQVFIEKEATDTQVTQMGEQIRQIEGVNTVTFVSEAEALNQVREKLKDKQALIAGWDEENPFRASYIVTLTDLSLSEEVIEQLDAMENVYNVESSDTTINGLVAIANGVRVVSAVILTLLILISIFIIANTIKLTVHARRKEISIMKYVGATDSFIRWPFIIEGIIIGITAAIISIVVLGIAYSLITNAMADSALLNRMGMSLLGFSDMISLLIIVYLGLGIGIGTLGSAISMRKYLQV